MAMFRAIVLPLFFIGAFAQDDVTTTPGPTTTPGQATKPMSTLVAKICGKNKVRGVLPCHTAVEEMEVNLMIFVMRLFFDIHHHSVFRSVKMRTSKRQPMS